MSHKFTPTQQQLDIVEAFKHNQVIKINAVAGSGKTSTLELLANEFKQPSLLLAFNKSIADEAGTRFPKHVTCRTMHSIAWAEFGKRLQHKIGPNKNPKVNTLRSIRNIIDWFKLEDYTDAVPPISDRTIAALAKDTVERFCHSDHLYISNQNLYYKDFKELKKNHDFDEDTLSKVIVHLAKLLYKEHCNPVSTAWTPHDVYMKLWSLSNPKLNYGILYVDESQDINPCALSVLEKQSCKIVYVGDQHQSIYAFRGAINAMQKIVAPTMQLSQSWRYGEKVAHVAETILSKYDMEVIGNPEIQSDICTVSKDDNYTMIFRTNAGLLEKAEELIDEGIEVRVEINVKDFVYQLKSTRTLMQGGKPFHDNIARFGSWSELLEFSKESVEVQRLVKMAMRADVADLIERLEKANKSKEPQVVLTTAHKSKGLEFDNVIIGDDFKFGEKETLDIPEQELNLLYVACTRAKKKLQIPTQLGRELESHL